MYYIIRYEWSKLLKRNHFGYTKPKPKEEYSEPYRFGTDVHWYNRCILLWQKQSTKAGCHQQKHSLIIFTIHSFLLTFRTWMKNKKTTSKWFRIYLKWDLLGLFGRLECNKDYWEYERWWNVWEIKDKTEMMRSWNVKTMKKRIRLKVVRMEWVWYYKSNLKCSI